ncbi:MAG: cytidylate kinase-like family protein [Bacteroidales bacterium]|nr:cytidylate kinase-like family protein [Bacteroidales bacterium]
MNTQEKFVITVSREIGSGGRTVGRKLAERLGVYYSDKDLIKELSKKFDLTPYAIEKLKGEKKNWFADFIRFVAPVAKESVFVDTDKSIDPGFRAELSSEEVFKAESEILKAIASEGSCVIAGRSGFFVLKDCPNKLDIFITASRDKRVERVSRKQGFTAEQAGILIDDVDEGRENYIKRYTGTSRYDLRNYDLVLNMDNLTEDEAVDIILNYIHA